MGRCCSGRLAHAVAALSYILGGMKKPARGSRRFFTLKQDCAQAALLCRWHSCNRLSMASQFTTFHHACRYSPRRF